MQVHEPLFITPKDLMKVFNHIKTYHGAWLHIRSIKKNIGKQAHQVLTMREFAEWHGIDTQIVIEKLSA